MTTQELFLVADKALHEIIKQLTDEMLAMKADPKLSWGKAETMRDIINYHAYDEAWVPDTLEGKTIEEVGDKYNGNLLGDDLQTNYAAITTKTQQFVATFNDLDKQVHLTYGDFSAEDYIKHITTYRGFRVYTLAKIFGLDSTMTDDLVSGLSDMVLPEVEDWRKMGVFGPAIEVPDDADAQTKLLAATGFLQQ